MFVAYLDHDRPKVQIQDRDCLYLEVGTETSGWCRILVISGEGRRGRLLHGFCLLGLVWEYLSVLGLGRSVAHSWVAFPLSSSPLFHWSLSRQPQCHLFRQHRNLDWRMGEVSESGVALHVRPDFPVHCQHPGISSTLADSSLQH